MPSLDHTFISVERFPWLMPLLRAVPVFGWLMLSAVFFAFGEYLSKRWADAPSLGLAITVVLVDAISTTLWLPAILDKNHLAIVGLLWLLVGAVATVFVGLFIFRETLDWTQWMGMAFAFAALVLLGK